MPAQRLAPDGILARKNLSGSLELIQDDPDTPDARYLWVNVDDALKRRTRAELKRFTDWLAANGVKGYLGEFGWPQTKDTHDWNRVADTFYDTCDDAGVIATQWSAGGNWPSTYVLLSYGESTATSAAEVIERHLETSTLRRGVNVAGAEFSHNTLANGTLFSNINPGVHGTDYFYPSAAHLSYIASRGVKTIRLPFRWERWQRSLLGALDTTEIGLAHQVLVDANAAGLKVILDCHNYARYMLGTDTATRTELIMTKDGTLNYTHLNDFWTKVSQWVKADVTRDATVLGYGLMNEPNGMATWTAPFTANVTHATFETDTEGWLADTGVTLARSTAQAHTGVASLTATKAFAATGYDQIRPRSADRAVGNRDLSAGGNTMMVRVFIPSTAPGTGWIATPYLFDSAFTNIQPGPDTALTKGQWTDVAADFTTTQLSDVISMGVQVGGMDVNATVDVYIDQYEQGSSTGSLTAAEVWEGATQEALNAIRGVPDNRLITVAGYHWSGVQNWTTYHPDKWITDAQNNHVYEAHHYWDAINGYTGTYPDTYAAELSKAQADGW